MQTKQIVKEKLPGWLRLLAGVAVIFGGMTVFSGGMVLFGPPEARMAAGHYVPFVVWFNFLAGFAYVATGLGLWIGAGWARTLAILIAASTIAVAVVFGGFVAMGGAFEMRTVAALTLRGAVWIAIAVASRRVIG